MLYLFHGREITFSIFSGILRAIKRGTIVLFSPVLARLIHFGLSHPRLKALILALLLRCPVLEEHLYWFAMARGLIPEGTTARVSSDPSKLTPSAVIIYTNLKAAIDQHNMDD